MALDLGERRIGIAISDESGSIAQAFKVIDRKKVDLLDEIKRIVDEHKIERIIVGLPLALDGKIKRQAKKALKIAHKLAQVIKNIKIETFDERLSTREVENLLIEGNIKRKKRRQIKDKLSAAIILQTYLERQRRRRQQRQYGM